MTSRKATLLAGSLLTVLAAGCTRDLPTAEPQDDFVVTPFFTAVDVGSTLQMSATLGGAPAQVTWASDDIAIATVSATGLVTGVGPGTAGITASLQSQPSRLKSASVTALPLPTALSLSGLASSGPRGSIVMYRIVVKPGATRLTVTVSGGSGDVDIYVRGLTPATIDGVPPNACISENGGNGESCIIDNPTPGLWYIAFGLWDPYAGVTLTATQTPP